MSRLLTSVGAMSLVLFLLVLSLPVGPQAQAMLGVAGLAAMLVIDKVAHRGPGRIAFLVVGLALVVRYMVWRMTATLPPASDVTNHVASLVVLSAELFCFLTMLLGLFAVARPMDRPRARQLAPDEAPMIDVFVPSYNESLDLVAATLAAAKAIRYPADKLKVHLLDDGGTDQRCNSPDPLKAAAARQRREDFSRMAAELGVTYHARAYNEHAKAGNLNAALMKTDGDLVVVFDADHAPSREFLEETVGHFADDPRLFLVQTPHFFLNPDPIERNLATFATMPSENEMFYGIVQKGLDNWNAAFFCGSAAVLRRSALEEVGGFSGVSITEDCETALDLHSRGWRSLYVDRPMIAGLQPETFASFIGQRSRWCRGMIQILILKNPLMRPGLSIAQRICYLSSSLSWLFPIPRAIFLVAPLLFLFLDMQIYRATMEEFFSYTMVYMAALLLMQGHLYGRVRWPLISELYEYVQSVHLLPAVWSVLTNPRKPKFDVTDKGISVENDYLSELSTPYYVIFAVLLAAVGVSIMRWSAEPEARDLILVIGLWNLLNLVVAGLALGVVSERRERRRMPRLAQTSHPAVIAVEGVAVPAFVTDVSGGGLKLRPVGDRATRVMPGQKATLRVRVETDGDETEVLQVSVDVANSGVDGEGRFVGLRFADLSPARFRLIAALVYADIDAIRTSRLHRRVRRFLPIFLVKLLGWSATATARGVSYLLRHRTGDKKTATDKSLAPASGKPAAAASAAAPAPFDMTLFSDEATDARASAQGLAPAS
ncbi:UDP-forming cellulose synthase catalytic subunit [Mongoliimonas terrestris]|uniref:UDP-forming cellulose synthase catalytic subunit n=1 Tax=Mongoliimonas terrestris TaxID=1709001 RepID=UPI0009FB5E80|nr:UDP-forming cellulose synthase catalytic subunit [Mongoliimonas terrestris]